MIKPVLDKLLVAYGAGLPYHPGKWRVVEALYRAGGLADWHPDRIRDASRAGVRWRLNPRSLVQRSLYYLGFYERQETAWILSQAQPGWVLFDVGANFGYYSLRVAAALGDRASIHSFEPEEGMHARLTEHARLNGFTSIHPQRLALSNVDGELDLVAPSAGNEGIGHLRTGGMPAPGHARLQRVPSLRMDTYVQTHGVTRLDFVKIDVEGAEGLVLEGAAETLRRLRPRMMVEINPEALAPFGMSGDDLLRAIRALGYETHRLEGARLVPLTQASAIGEYVNAICMPRNP